MAVLAARLTKLEPPEHKECVQAYCTVMEFILYPSRTLRFSKRVIFYTACFICLEI